MKSILLFNAVNLGLGKVPLTEGGFQKLTNMSANERQKLIFKTLTERISCFRKKITAKKQKQNGFFQPKIAFNVF